MMKFLLFLLCFAMSFTCCFAQNVKNPEFKRLENQIYSAGSNQIVTYSLIKKYIALSKREQNEDALFFGYGFGVSTRTPLK